MAPIRRYTRSVIPSFECPRSALASEISATPDAAFGLISRNCAVRVRAEEVYRALTDEQTKQARLRDRLATADLRLSVLLDAIGSNGSGGVQATTGAGGVVHVAHRAKLDPAHAQRIIGITGDGDQGLIALQACQAFAKEVSGKK